MLNKSIGKHLSILLLLFFACSSLFASNEEEHYAQLLQVLFGRDFTLGETENRYMVPLKEALYLTVDLFDNAIHGKGQRYLDNLRRFGVENLPRVDAIDFTGVWENGRNVHQRYTHRGWDWNLYPRNLRYDYQNIWETRKQIMISAVDKIFGSREDEEAKRESFAALLYCVHILGDHIGDNKRSLPDRMPLNGSRDGRTATRTDIVWELETHIPRLFRGQTGAVEYLMLMKYLQEHRSKPSFAYSDTISDNDYRRLQDFAEELLYKQLKVNIPGLLKNENFFRRVFY